MDSDVFFEFGGYRVTVGNRTRHEVSKAETLSRSGCALRPPSGATSATLRRPVPFAARLAAQLAPPVSWKLSRRMKYSLNYTAVKMHPSISEIIVLNVFKSSFKNRPNMVCIY